MPIFICPTCLTVGNTACDYYWSEHQDHEESCTGCRPDGYESKHGGRKGWHGRFERKQATGEWLIAIGYLTDEFACERTPIADQLVGEALERGATKESVADVEWDDLETISESTAQKILKWIQEFSTWRNG